MTGLRDRTAFAGGMVREITHPANVLGAVSLITRLTGSVGANACQRVNFLYFTRVGSIESGPRRRTLSSS